MPAIDLTGDDIEVLLTSLEYSKLRIRDTPDTPYEVRTANLARIDAVAANIRAGRKANAQLAE